MLLTHFEKLDIFPKSWLDIDYYLQGYCQKILGEADIQINGRRAWDMNVHNPLLYRRVLLRGSLGLGEAYMDGWWDAKRVDEFFERIFRANIPEKFSEGITSKLLEMLSRILNLQSKKRATIVAKAHYDIGNELYRNMLDSRMVYSCGYWKKASSLEEAQEDKLDLICRKLHLKAGMTLLDIGCGWGGLAKFAAENYRVQVTGVTISEEQYKLAKKTCKGLPVEIQLKDYRDIQGQYDRVVSVGMFEHVGYHNYRTFMETAHRSLKEEGLFLLHTIGGNSSEVCTDEWINHYIFPNSMIPSARQISQAYEKLFVMEDWHNFGPDYDKTLMAWYHNFTEHWPRLAAQYDKRFYRMWTYYLLVCAACFRARKDQLWQIVLSKGTLPMAYRSFR